MPNENFLEIKSLVNIGLNEKEAVVYISLCELGEATAYKIYKKTQIKEPTVYVILEQLKKKNLVLNIPNNKKKLFIAVSLDKYLENIQESLITARKVNQDIKNKTKKDGKPKVLFFDGLNEVKKALYFGFEKMEGMTLFQTYGALENSKKKRNRWCIFKME